MYCLSNKLKITWQHQNGEYDDFAKLDGIVLFRKMTMNNFQSIISFEGSLCSASPSRSDSPPSDDK